ncbi:MAG TPA: response regulator transcription factor [Flavobacteriales bacterium]|nr:response regulator transcription factor [Flavobacteriales bacterium]
MALLKILTVDDHQLIIDGLTTFLKEEPEFDHVGFCNNGQQAVDYVKTVKVDLILMDIDMPVLNGLDATQRIKQLNPGIKIIILTMHDEKSLVKRFMEIGADGYSLKNTDKTLLIEIIKKVASGKKHFPDELLREKENPVKKILDAPSDAILKSQLTDREIEILSLISQGFSNKEIGDKLFISHRTVDTHRTNLMKKLDVSNIAGLIKKSYELKIIE